ncbi:spermatogenesis-associated protein 5-like [Planoprotostelium fungivorum]|uniref:Spermatogenesis-associated protein 5-like n=1 Tax=Planoprotostelium fungivorum TaxID=1890364 RepID=A0A2P6NIT8_9EUKA|nr:spermatogenesis-associated protein 5-like [Planoprotostelium fungivorum]
MRRKLIHSPIPGLIRSPAKVRGIVYIHQRTMRSMALRTGGLVRLSADDDESVPFYALAWPTAKIAENQICMDLTIRENSEIEIGKQLQVLVVDEMSIPSATEMSVDVVYPPNTSDADKKSLEEELKRIPPGLMSLLLSQQIEGRFFVKENTFFASVSGRPRRFKIDGVKTSGGRGEVSAFAVTPATQVSFNLQPAKKKTEKEEAKLDYSNIGGLSLQISTIMESVNLAFNSNELLTQYGNPSRCSPHSFEFAGISPPKGVLLYGPPGTGKTLIARVIAAQCNAHITVINGPEFLGSYLGESEGRLRNIFREAEEKSPAFIFVDEIDAVCGARNTDTSEMEKRVTGAFLTLLDGINEKKKVFVLGATNRPNSLDPALRRPGRFDKEIEIPIPTAEARLEILKVYLNRASHVITDDEIRKVAADTHGYVGADLSVLCKEAGMRALKRVSVEHDGKIIIDKLTITFDDLQSARHDVIPSAMREVTVEVPKVLWTDIGGYDDVKMKLREAIELPLRHPEAFKRLGVEPPKGLLLYGPPGCSKTLMAKALATEAGLNFIAVKGPELYGKYVGQSERAVREIFRKARAASPSIIFFDEIDALAGSRDQEGGGGVSDRVISQLLSEMNGIEQMRNVTIVAATNRPDMMDPALLAAGRFDRILYVSPPDISSRREIFNLSLHSVPHAAEVTAEVRFTDYNQPVNVGQVLAEMSQGYSGAECASIVREASLRALEEDIDCEELNLSHFYWVFSELSPGITRETIQFYERWRESSGKRSIYYANHVLHNHTQICGVSCPPSSVGRALGF